MKPTAEDLIAAPARPLYRLASTWWWVAANVINWLLLPIAVLHAASEWIVDSLEGRRWRAEATEPAAIWSQRDETRRRHAELADMGEIPLQQVRCKVEDCYLCGRS